MELRTETYPHQLSVCTREEIEGHPLEVTCWETTTRYRGRDCPTHVILWKGVHWMKLGDQPPFLVERSMIHDSGPKLGVTLQYTRCPETPVTAEERAENRRRAKEICMETFGRMLVYPDEDMEEEIRKYIAAHPGKFSKAQ